jgi:diadenosine tetraphosphatase ApaH/serine/threonine PP2A family protein phosphatase
MKKIALLADLHANREALESVLDHAAACGATDYVLLGDFVGYGADPAWVVDRVRRLVDGGALVVCGNHDEAVVNGSHPGMRADAKYVIDWTRDQLDRTQIEFLASLPMAAQQDDRLYVHANAWNPDGWEYILSRSEAMRSLHATSAAYTFCGHVHEPKLYHIAPTGKAGEFVPMPGVPIPVPAHRQWLVIPGSAGQPRDGNPAACYALFEPGPQVLTFQRVPYDTATAGAKIAAAGLPQRLADRLDEGH